MEVNLELTLTVIVALVIYLLNSRKERMRARNDATFEMLRTIIFEDGPIYQANLRLVEWSSSSEIFDDDKIEVEKLTTVAELLNFFDLIADSAERDVIDKEMVIQHLGGRMSNANLLLAKYIEARRVTLKRDGLYRSFQDFMENNAQAISRV